MEAASIDASICDLPRSDSFKVKAPETFEKCPFTFAIIMCLTLNSAAECDGSMFQVVVLVVVCGMAVVLTCFSFHFLRCVTTIFVATYISAKKTTLLWLELLSASLVIPSVCHRQGGQAVGDASPAQVRQDGTKASILAG